MSSPRRRFTSPRGRKPTGLAKKYPRAASPDTEPGDEVAGPHPVAMERPARRILVADGSAESAAGTAFVLARAGYRVATAGTIAEAQRELRHDRYALMLLDAMLGGESALGFLRSIRSRGSSDAPERRTSAGIVVMLDAAMAISEQRYRALAEGADDVLVRPFDARELLLRTAVLLRRIPSPPPPSRDTFHMDSLYIDFTGHVVLVGDRSVDLTRSEFDLLRQLAEHRGRLCTREMLARSATSEAPTTSGRGIDMRVSRMRRKLGLAGAMIENVRGEGYRLRVAKPVRHP